MVAIDVLSHRGIGPTDPEHWASEPSGAGAEALAEADGNRTRGRRVRSGLGWGESVEAKRRRTGIEPAHRGAPGAPVLKTGRDTSPHSPPGSSIVGPEGGTMALGKVGYRRGLVPLGYKKPSFWAIYPPKQDK